MPHSYTAPTTPDLGYFATASNLKTAQDTATNAYDRLSALIRVKDFDARTTKALALLLSDIGEIKMTIDALYALKTTPPANLTYTRLEAHA